VASGVDGFAAGGIGINVPDSLLVQLAPDVDESATNGKVALATPPTPILALGFAGLTTPGTHLLAVANKREGDADFVRMHRVKVHALDTTTGKRVTWPARGFEYLEITPEP